MDSTLFTIFIRLSSNLQFSRRLSGTLTRNVFASRSYSTGRNPKVSLYSKIRPLSKPSLHVVSELKKWVEAGKKVRVKELQRIFRDLRKRKRYTQALEVSEWMNNKGVYTFSPSDHAVQLDLIGRVRGLDSAESYFNKIGDPDKTDKIYGALLSCYVRARLTDKSLSHMQKMKDMGFALSALAYNDLMRLYANVGQNEKVPDVLAEMKENGVSPDNFSYKLCINSYRTRSDLDVMEKLLEEMESQPQVSMDWTTYATVANFYIKAGLTDKAITTLKKSEEKLDKKNGLGYNHLISLYTSLGDKDEVLRLWGLEKDSLKRYINRDYITMLGSLVKLGDFEEAETLLKEWESSGNCYDFRVPNTLLVGYCRKGLVVKAKALLEDIMEKGKSSTSNSWGIVAVGKKVRVAELQPIVRDLRKRKRYMQALEISELMNNKGVCTFSPSDHAMQLDLIGRVRGLDSAESYFNKISDQDKTDKTYAALLNCYVRARLTDKSLSHMQKMKDMGFASSPLSYNDLMCLYTNVGQYEKVPDVLAEMKESGISPDNFSYRLCINSYGTRSDLDEMEKLLEEMENQPHISMDWTTYATVANFYIKAGLTDKAITTLTKSEEKLVTKNGLGYNHLISLYASLGNKNEVLRLWRLEKDALKRYMNRDYITMLESLVKLGELEEAETLLKEWESSGNYYDFRVPNTLLIGYCQKGLVEKAGAMLEDIMEKGKSPTPNSWGIVAAGYVDQHKMEKAVESMKVALSLCVDNEGWKPNPKVVRSILNWLGDKGDIEGVETFVDSLRSVIPMDRQMYHTLIKANIRSGKEVDGLVEGMTADKFDEDEETKKILSLRHA
ncbi:hypothetical protein HHK36_005353 [Tetracentron sinense]|uniref:Pentatricopeptide repeat-containing protein n=1 Tax=Tetracentron sinense TaxID=13715 RepID=A0A835DQM5_TETSI|nr:hypothetical protein HHK36_005353 [Tetracentron sinense]